MCMALAPSWVRVGNIFTSPRPPTREPLPASIGIVAWRIGPPSAMSGGGACGSFDTEGDAVLVLHVFLIVGLQASPFARDEAAGVGLARAPVVGLTLTNGDTRGERRGGNRRTLTQSARGSCGTPLE